MTYNGWSNYETWRQHVPRRLHRRRHLSRSARPSEERRPTRYTVAEVLKDYVTDEVTLESASLDV